MFVGQRTTFANLFCLLLYWRDFFSGVCDVHCTLSGGNHPLSTFLLTLGVSQLYLAIFYFIFNLCMCDSVCVYVCVYVPWHMCGNRSTTCMSHCSPSIMCISGIKRRVLSLTGLPLHNRLIFLSTIFELLCVSLMIVGSAVLSDLCLYPLCYLPSFCPSLNVVLYKF